MVTPVFAFAVAASVSVFLTALWSTGRSVVASGALRAAHLASIGFAIALLLSFGLGAPVEVTQSCGAALALSSLSLIVWERARIWPVCMLQATFGAVIALGLPLIYV